MKKLSLTAGLILLAVAARAQTVPNPTNGVAQQYQSTATATAVQVASGTAAGNNSTPMLTSNAAKLWRAVSIQNQDATANLYCSDAAGVCVRSGSTYSGCIGWQIVPGGAASFILVPGEQWYCVNDTTSRTAIAIAVRGY